MILWGTLFYMSCSRQRIVASKVRLLIDDQNGIKLDGILRSLLRIPTLKLDYLILINFVTYVSSIISSDLKVNHRMHNKLIIADASIAVTGSRNISSEYFEAK